MSNVRLSSILVLIAVFAGGLVGLAAPELAVAGGGSGSGLERESELQAVLTRAVENAAHDLEVEREFKAHYAYTRTKTTERKTRGGDLEKRTIKVIEHDPGMAGRADVDVPDEEQDEDSRKRAYERRDFNVTPAILKKFCFTYVGQGMHDGRTAWVIDFEPAGADLPASSLKERFLNKTAGRVWIDQQDTVLARASFRLTEPLNLLGGLVGALRKCEVALVRGRTDAGLWYTRSLTWEIEGRKLAWPTFMNHTDEIESVRSVTRPAS